MFEKTKTSRFKLIALLSALLIALGTASCEKEKKETAKSMDQLRESEGIPVHVVQVALKKFEKELSFYSRLSGIEEAVKSSMVDDKLKKLNFKVGDNVREGQIVMEFPADNPVIQFTQAKTALDNAEKLYNRMKELLKAGESSQQNFDNAETQYLVSKRNFEALKQMVYVEAPISGTVVDINLKPGENIENNKPLFTIARLERMKAKIWVSEEEVMQLRLGMQAVITIGDREFTGRISEIGLSMDLRQRAFGVEVLFDNPQRLLRTGTTVDVRIKVYEKPDAVIIPRNLILNDEGKPFVYIEENATAVKRYIKTGMDSGVEIEILDGLKPGDKYIGDGITLLRDGVKINIIQ